VKIQKTVCILAAPFIFGHPHFFWCRESILSEIQQLWKKSYPFSLKFGKEDHSMYYYVLIFVRHPILDVAMWGYHWVVYLSVDDCNFLFEKLASEKIRHNFAWWTWNSHSHLTCLIWTGNKLQRDMSTCVMMCRICVSSGVTTLPPSTLTGAAMSLSDDDGLQGSEMSVKAVLALHCLQWIPSFAEQTTALPSHRQPEIFKLS
jgi:hypothetical protein